VGEWTQKYADGKPSFEQKGIPGETGAAADGRYARLSWPIPACLNG